MNKWVDRDGKGNVFYYQPPTEEEIMDLAKKAREDNGLQVIKIVFGWEPQDFIDNTIQVHVYTRKKSIMKAVKVWNTYMVFFEEFCHWHNNTDTVKEKMVWVPLYELSNGEWVLFNFTVKADYALKLIGNEHVPAPPPKPEDPEPVRLINTR